MQKITLNVADLHRKFSWYGRNAREWVRKCVLLLPEIERERVWEKKGFASIYVYASKLAGMSHESVNDALRVLRQTEQMPAIQKVIEERGINIIKPILTLLTEDNQEQLAEKAMTMSKPTLEMYARELRRPRSSENIDSPHQQAISKIILPMDLDPEIAQKLEQLRGDDDWNTLMQEFLEMREKMLEQEQPEQKVTDSRHIPAAIKQFVITRSRGFCEFKRCQKKYNILHHTQRFSLEKTHDPERIIALCKAHERIVHLGLIEDETIQTSEWKLIERADKEDPRYNIDQLVQKYRQPYHISFPMPQLPQ